MPWIDKKRRGKDHKCRTPKLNVFWRPVEQCSEWYCRKCLKVWRVGWARPGLYWLYDGKSFNPEECSE